MARVAIGGEAKSEDPRRQDGGHHEKKFLRKLSPYLQLSSLAARSRTFIRSAPSPQRLRGPLVKRLDPAVVPQHRRHCRSGDDTENHDPGLQLQHCSPPGDWFEDAR